MKRKNLSPGALTAPLPPCMVTVGDMENNNILTVAWTGILATQPPKTYISVRPSRHSHTMLGVGKEFVINLPPAHLAREVDFVGIYTGKKMDKFDRCKLTRVKSALVSPPTVAQCPIALECRVTEVKNMGSHHVFFADIVSVSCREDIIEADGKIRFDKADLLAYAHGEYYRLGEVIGKFGFSTNKKTNTQKGELKKNNQESSANKGEQKEEEKKEKEPFYKTAPKSKNQKKKTPSDKGKPHGRRQRG